MLLIMRITIVKKSNVNSTEKINISSMLKQKKGVHYLEGNHINYFKNAENVYKGGILKKFIING